LGCAVQGEGERIQGRVEGSTVQGAGCQVLDSRQGLSLTVNLLVDSGDEEDAGC